MSTATNISSFTDGSYSKAERIGNGSYGTKDVDMYKLVVSSSDLGRTYTFTTSFPGGTGDNQGLDTYIRLFNSSGTVLDYNDDGGYRNYSKLIFTPAVAGTYYLGVSNYGNRTYNPSTANSGTAGSTGVYKLQVDRSLATPTGLAAAPVANSSSQIKLTWTATPGATSYTVQRSTNGTTWSNTGTAASNTYTYSGLSSNTTYYFHVRANDTTGSSPYSTNITAKTSPAAPGGVTASAVAGTSNQIRLTWNAVTGAANYTVQRSSNGTSGWTNVTTTVTGTSYTNTGLSANTTYYYRVFAKNSTGGSSPYSTTVSTKTNPVVAPSAPTANVVSSSRIRLSWNAVSGATGYTLERSLNQSTWTAIYTGAGTDFADTSLSSNTKYYYRIKSNGSGGSSAYSVSSNATTKLTTPTGATTSASSYSQINLAWNAVTGATAYIVERSSTGTGGWTTVYTGTATSYSNTGLSANTKYYYHIKATTSSNQSAYTANVSGTTSPGPLSTAPTGLSTHAVSSSRIKLDWNAVSGATSYTLERSTTGTGSWATVYTGSDTSYANANLSANTTYYYRVKASNSSYASGYSTTANGLTKLATPSNIAANAVGPSRIMVGWDAVPGATNYTLECSTDQSSWTTVYTGTNTIYSNPSLSTTTKYYYRVKASNSNNSSEYSGILTFLSGRIDRLPTAIIENADSLSVQEGLWLSITGNGVDPLGQGLTYFWDLTGSGNFVQYSGNSALFSAENLNGFPGSTQTIRLKVRDADGLESPIVEAVVAIIDVPPSYSVIRPGSSELIAGHYTEWTFTAYDIRFDPPMSWVVRWGDGTETVVGAGPRQSVTLDHVFRASGNLEITVITTDLGGIEFSFSFLVFIQTSDLV